VDPASSPTADLRPRRVLERALLLATLAALAVAAVVWLPALDPVRDRFADTRPAWVVAAAAFQLASALCFVVAFRAAFERRIGWRAAFDLAAVEQGANILLPTGGSGGLAIGAVLLVRAGVPARFAASRTAVLFLVTSAASFAALIVAGVGAATGLLPGDAAPVATLGPAAGAVVLGTAAVVVPRRVPTLAARPEQRLRMAVRRGQLFLRESVNLSVAMIRGGDLLLVGGSVGYFVLDVASLAAAFEALGDGPLPIATFVLAYVLGHAGALIPVPGSAEGGLVGMFTAYGSPLSLAVGAVLAYRTFHAGIPLFFGLVGYADIRRLRRDGPSTEDVARRFA
jgi:uncharacterized membrane protein YbhN (UPF0104 family)